MYLFSKLTASIDGPVDKKETRGCVLIGQLVNTV